MDEDDDKAAVENTKKAEDTKASREIEEIKLPRGKRRRQKKWTKTTNGALTAGGDYDDDGCDNDVIQE